MTTRRRPVSSSPAPPPLRAQPAAVPRLASEIEVLRRAANDELLRRRGLAARHLRLAHHQLGRRRGVQRPTSTSRIDAPSAVFERGDRRINLVSNLARDVQAVRVERPTASVPTRRETSRRKGKTPHPRPRNAAAALLREALGSKGADAALKVPATDARHGARLGDARRVRRRRPALFGASATECRPRRALFAAVVARAAQVAFFGVTRARARAGAAVLVENARRRARRQSLHAAAAPTRVRGARRARRALARAASEPWRRPRGGERRRGASPRAPAVSSTRSASRCAMRAAVRAVARNGADRRPTRSAHGGDAHAAAGRAAHLERNGADLGGASPRARKARRGSRLTLAAAEGTAALVAARRARDRVRPAWRTASSARRPDRGTRRTRSRDRRQPRARPAPAHGAAVADLDTRDRCGGARLFAARAPPCDGEGVDESGRGCARAGRHAARATRRHTYRFSVRYYGPGDIKAWSARRVLRRKKLVADERRRGAPLHRRALLRPRRSRLEEASVPRHWATSPRQLSGRIDSSATTDDARRRSRATWSGATPSTSLVDAASRDRRRRALRAARALAPARLAGNGPRGAVDTRRSTRRSASPRRRRPCTCIEAEHARARPRSRALRRARSRPRAHRGRSSAPRGRRDARLRRAMRARRSAPPEQAEAPRGRGRRVEREAAARAGSPRRR